MVQHFEHIVIGTGSMGSSACYHLAKRGRRVLGLDRFTPPHKEGSHSGQTRIIRKAYFEHPDYIPLLFKAYENWRTLEEESGREVYFETGIFYAGPKGNRILQGIRSSAATYGIGLEVLRHNTAGVFRLPDDYELLFEPEAGFLSCDSAIETLLQEAVRHGAVIKGSTRVTSWELEEDKVRVYTEGETFTADRLVITAGAWSDRLIPGITDKLKVTRQVLAWFKTDGNEKYRMGHFPCWLIADAESTGAYYGFPELSVDGGLKLAWHHPGSTTDPESVERKVGETDLEKLRGFIERHLPGANGPLLDASVCLYENSPDGDFVIDQLNGTEDRVCFAWGFSGHGFKFASVVGEILADLSMEGKTVLPIGFLRADRF